MTDLTAAELAARRESYLERMAGIIADSGWGLQGVFPTSPDDPVSFVYTVGASLSRPVGTQRPDPEIIVFGLPMDTAGAVLNDLVAKHRNGTRPIVVGHRYDDVVAQYEVTFIDVTPENTDEHLTVANRLCAEQIGMERVPAVQLVWPDDRNRLPWQPGFDARFIAVQPLLGSPSEGEGDPA